MPDLLLERRDNIAIVTLNRPAKHNAMTPELVVRLADTWRELNDDAATRVVVLTGAGSQAFCSGGDLGRLLPLLTRARPPDDEWDERFLADRTMLNSALLRDLTFFKPIVAAINGYALAGGTELMLATDIRIASTTSTFGLTEVKRGIIPGGGSLTRLARQVPWVHAMEMVLGGEPITAQQALQMGMVNRLVSPDDVLTTAIDVALRVGEGAPIALLKAKEAILRSNGRPLDEAFAIEEECARFVVRTEDAREGPLAFMQKRPPNFQGK